VNDKEHWEQVYAAKPAAELGWYEPHLEVSFSFIRGLSLPPEASIIDVGGGASTLVDDLLDEGYTEVTVLDLSGEALSRAKERLGAAARPVSWLEGDITSMALPASRYDLWHDRAVFHFLTDPSQRKRYLASLENALKQGGHLIIGTFAPEAPPKCSGLPVQRYTHGSLQHELGAAFVLERHQKALHVTPGGVSQMYLYCCFRNAA
jgi:SAM-dependent methyltransferase